MTIVIVSGPLGVITIKSSKAPELAFIETTNAKPIHLPRYSQTTGPLSWLVVWDPSNGIAIDRVDVEEWRVTVVPFWVMVPSRPSGLSASTEPLTRLHLPDRSGGVG